MIVSSFRRRCIGSNIRHRVIDQRDIDIGDIAVRRSSRWRRRPLEVTSRVVGKTKDFNCFIVQKSAEFVHYRRAASDVAAFKTPLVTVDVVIRLVESTSSLTVSAFISHRRHETSCMSYAPGTTFTGGASLSVIVPIPLVPIDRAIGLGGRQ